MPAKLVCKQIKVHYCWVCILPDNKGWHIAVSLTPEIFNDGDVETTITSAQVTFWGKLAAPDALWWRPDGFGTGSEKYALRHKVVEPGLQLLDVNQCYFQTPVQKVGTWFHFTGGQLRVEYTRGKPIVHSFKVEPEHITL